MRVRTSHFLAALMLVFPFDPVLADTGDWQWVYPSTGVECYYGVDVWDDDRVAIVGTSNTRLVSTDGGVSWRRTSFGVSYGPLLAVQWLDATTLVACGGFGLVLRSEDAGASWMPIGDVPPVNLLDAQFTSAATGYACATNGNVYKTADGGSHWTPQYVAAGSLYDITFLDDDHGWAVNGSGGVYRTDNGGAVWSHVETLPFALHAVAAWDFDTVVIGGDSRTVYATGNGGADWSTFLLDQAGSDLRVTGIVTSGDGSALLTTETPFGPVMEERGEVFRTTDYGVSWARKSIALQFLLAAHARNGAAWAVGKYGRITHSSNNGETWQDVTPPVQAELRTIDFPTRQHGVVMRIQDAQLSIPYTQQWITDDAGQSFQRDLFNGGDILDVTAVSAVDADIIYAAVFGPAAYDVAAGLRKSLDGGTTWSFVLGSSCPPGDACPLPFRFTAIDMVADGTGFACTSSGRAYRFFAADDTASVAVTSGGAALNDVAAIDASRAVTVGIGGFIAYTTDGGATWLPANSGTPNHLNAVAFTPSGDAGLTVGEGAVLLRTVDGGASWSSVSPGGATAYRDVAFVAEHIAVVCTNAGDALVSVDGGVSWKQEQVTVQLNDVTRLAATDQGVYAIVADRGIAYRSFENVVPTLFQDIDARVHGRDVVVTWNVFTTDALDGFTVYRDGLPVHTGLLDASTAEFVDHSVPEGEHSYFVVASDKAGEVARSPQRSVTVAYGALSLGYNRPNPFNPSTEIPFILDRAGPVEIAIYDVGGRHVATIARGTLSAGAHTAHWDGRSSLGQPVSSGVYFYRLRAGNRTLTRRMVLLK